MSEECVNERMMGGKQSRLESSGEREGRKRRRSGCLLDYSYGVVPDI